MKIRWVLMHAVLMRLVWECATKADWMRTERQRIHVLPRQKEAMHRLVSELLQRYPDAKVVGHRDLSPDTNYNGIVDPWERIKECPCFEVKAETW